MESWNERYICKPSNFTKIYSRNDLESVDSVTKSLICSDKLKTIKTSENVNPEKWLHSLLDIFKTFTSFIIHTEKKMRFESKYLHAYIYQNGCLKKEKFMQAMKKVGKCLKRWAEIDLGYLVSDTLEMIPADFYYIQSIRLPSTHCMYYLLQRLVATFYLLLQCASYCMEAAVYFRAKILTGHFINRLTLGYGIVARVRTFALNLANVIATVNDKLHPCVMALVEVFPYGKVNAQPQNLKEELANFRKGESGANAKKNIRRLEDDELDSLSTENEDSEKEGNPNKDEVNATSSAEGSVSFLSLHTHENDDVGEQVSYEKFEALKRLSQNVINSAGAKAVNLEKGNQEVGSGIKGKKNTAKRKRTPSNKHVALSLIDYSEKTRRLDVKWVAPEFSEKLPDFCFEGMREVTEKGEHTKTRVHSSHKRHKIRYFVLNNAADRKVPSPKL